MVEAPPTKPFTPELSNTPPEGDKPKVPVDSTEKSSRPSTEAAASALKKAQRLYDSAKSKHRTGNRSSAFLEAREAWNLVQGQDDPLSQELTTMIRREIDLLADEISASNQDPPSRFRTLILK